MAPRTKRTYSLRPETVQRVRELSDRGYASSQDAIVDAAIERLYREATEVDEASRWALAAHDDGFLGEVAELRVLFDGGERWPS